MFPKCLFLYFVIVLLKSYSTLLGIVFLLILLCILFLFFLLGVAAGFLGSLFVLVFLVVGIGLRVLVLLRSLFLLVFLFCIPTWVLCLGFLVFGCLVGFWLCVEQFLF